jgi:hypothetical protein
LSREANRDNAGVVPIYAAKMEESWKNSAGSQILQIEDGIPCYKVTRLAVNKYITTHVLNVKEQKCACGRWQEFGYPCQDAMVYYRVIKKKMIVDVLDSDAISDFYKFHFYQELMEKIYVLLFWILWKQQMK